jgi:hypothetical protein
MDIGMLWFDESERSLKDRVEGAASFYAEKYGVAPTLCLVHPSMLNGEGTEFGEIHLRKARSVMPNHFWVGIDENSHAGGSAPKKRTSKKADTKAKKSGGTAKAKTSGSKT